MKSNTRLRYGFSVLAFELLVGNAAVAAGSPGPVPATPTPAIVEPRDKLFPGTIQLSIDATDVVRKIVQVHEVIPVEAGDLTLFYPKWLPGTHAPKGAIDRLAGLEIKANGQKIAWLRDPVDVYAFRLTVPGGVAKLDVDFQYLSPVNDDVGEAEITDNMMVLEPIRLSLLPGRLFRPPDPGRARYHAAGGLAVRHRAGRRVGAWRPRHLQDHAL